jgi:large subunit ribosomal protein L4
MKLEVYNLKNEKVGEIDVADEIFGVPVKPWLHHTVVRAQQLNRRAGTVQVKTRSTVSGSGAKIYRQKGTGRARHGSRKVNLFVGGGVSHGPNPRAWELKVPKKVRRAALRSALSEKVQQGRLKIVDAFSLTEVKTKVALGALQALETSKALVVDSAANQNLKLSVRNLKDYKYLASEGLNVADVLRFEHLILSREALDQIQGRLL